MICSECAWEADMRRGFEGTGVGADMFMNRPSMKDRGHKACRGGTWCTCQHRTTR